MDLAVRAQWALQQPISSCHVSASSAARRKSEYTSRSFGGNGGSPSFLLLSCCARFPARNSSARSRNSAASAARPRAVVVLRAGSRPSAPPGRRKRMPAVVIVSIGGGSGLGMREAGSAVGSAWGNAGSEREPAGWVKARGSTVAAATAVSLAGDGSNLYSDVSNLGEPIVEQDVLAQQQQGEMEQGKGGAAAAVAAAAAAGVRGVQSLMGMEGTWQLLVSPAGGRFVESFVGQHIWSVSGFAGQSETSESDTESSASSSSSSDIISDTLSDSSSDSLSDDALKDSVCRPEIQSTVWDVDTAGRVSSLDLDDHEVYLLSVWLRSSLWLLPPVASSALEIRAVGGEEEIGEGGSLVGIPNGMRMEIDAHVAADDREILAINLIGQEVIMYVAVHRSDWLPRVAVVKAYGALETFTFTQWAPVAPDCPFLLPATVHRSTSAGAQQSFTSARTSLLPPGPAHILLHEKEASDSESNEASEEASPFSFSYDMPGSQTVPSPLSCFPEASFDESLPADVELFQSNSGHLLVRPRINGQDVGYFILDSGASCFTIEPAVADGLGLSSFGCVHTVTVHGPAECAFRRADSVQLGPLSISNALFVDVGGAALVQGLKPVVGICGYDVFRHAVVHVQARGRKGTLRLYKPQETPDAPKASSNATAGSTENGRSGEADTSETGLVQSAAAFADGSAANAPVPPGVAMAQRRGRGGARGGGGAGGRVGGGVAVVSAALVGGHPSMPDLGENIYWEVGGYWEVDGCWCKPLRMLGSVPHIAISFQEHWDSAPQSGLFLLDTGAAGVDIIFNARAVERCQLGRRAKGGDSWLKGMGGAGGGGGGQQMTPLKHGSSRGGHGSQRAGGGALSAGEEGQGGR
ncbi:unnamed protein product [Closterium sp. Naga37s-1]|nr:unnamed protein product [Closterium sp. Naga37s-1]